MTLDFFLKFVTFSDTCHPIPVCPDGFSDRKFQATCRTDVDDFEDNWEFTGGDSWAPEMCKNCQMESANNDYPIGGGGHYECDISEITNKKCFPKCSNGNTLQGSIFCDRTSGQYGGWISTQAQSFKSLSQSLIKCHFYHQKLHQKLKFWSKTEKFGEK